MLHIHHSIHSQCAPQGHEQLLKAAESRRKARRLYVILTFALSIALLMADAVFD